jgi:hypothetical protein
MVSARNVRVMCFGVTAGETASRRMTIVGRENVKRTNQEPESHRTLGRYGRQDWEITVVSRVGGTNMEDMC